MNVSVRSPSSPVPSGSPPGYLPWLALAAPESAAASLFGAELLARSGPPASSAPDAEAGPPLRPGPGPTAPRRGPALLLVALIVAVAIVEAGAALWPRVLPEEDLRLACTALRAEFQPGDLIVFAPPWMSQLGQRELGDLMPVTMLGRADARRYRRIWTVSFGSTDAAALREDIGGLAVSVQRRFGAMTLSRYEQEPVRVSYDLTEKLLTAQVTQAPATTAAPAPEVPCLWSGPLPTPLPPRGPAGLFRCPSATVERRVMEIDYRPRYGVVATVAPGQRTILEYAGIADADWQGGRLVLWLGLHDYHARKTAIGPAQVVVDLDQGARRVPLTVAVAQGFTPHELALPAGDRRTHVIRIEISAASPPGHFVGLHGELRR